MNQTLIQSISQEIYRRFPDFKGVRPKVQAQRSPQAKSPTGAQTYLLTFKHNATTAANKSLTRWVRVVATEQGKIIKITTSR